MHDHDGRSERLCDQPKESTATDLDTDRRALMGLAAGGLAGAMFGLAPTAAEATGGIGFVGSAQAQTGPATTTPWWPSKYGKDDQIGSTNLITPTKILDALKLVKTGKAYEMSHLYESSMPKFGERVFALRIPGAPTGGPLGSNHVIWNDEFVATEIGQVGTQMDGLGHIGMAFKGDDKTEMRFYNGFTAAEVDAPYGLKKLGVENVKPIITTGHLFDFAGLKGRSLNLGEEITVADLEGCLARQKMTADAIKPGDCVFLNTGWADLWNKDNAQYVKGEPGIGLDAAKWLIAKDVVLIGADTWAIEVVPNPDPNLAFPVHQELIAKNGIHIHECLVTSELAADSVYTFCYVMLPLKIKGATGSPGRPIALV
jgi:kynurenine formamidase/sorbitol-specific phosphotransferase system component IIA